MFSRVSRALVAFLFLFAAESVLPGPVSAQDQREVQGLTDALELMRKDDWGSALVAAGPEGAVARDIIEWHRLRAARGSFVEARAFLARRGDWPGLKLLRKRVEAAISSGADPQSVQAFFADQQPQTGAGALRLIEALAATGTEEEATAQAVLSWFSLPLDATTETAMLAAYGPALKPYHWQRLDMLLWRGLSAEAGRMLPHVDAGHAALAKARIALRKQRDGVDTLIAAVPQALQNDPGLAYERFLWRATKGRNQDAADMILARSGSAETLGDPDRWSSWRRVLARWSMREGKSQQAYRIASRHHLSEGTDHNDLEWLSGYIALRKLDDPARALTHFQTFRRSVQTPISLGRAGYWEGRAHEALGNGPAAQAAYAFGGEFQTSFYGQLAAEKAGLAMDPALTGAETFTGWRDAPFWSSSVMQAARLLQAAGELYLTERFTVHLSESLTRSEIGQLTAWAESLDEPHIELMIAKYVLRFHDYLLHRPYFPAPDIGRGNRTVPRAWELAITRRESEFDPQVISGVGARGLMQLMPGTARDMAKRLDIDYSKSRLITDPDYNTRLGSEYLAYLFEEVGNNPVLVSVGYNAGPGRSRSWSASAGHPARRGVDVVDWIEHIPFRETRNYVMRVSESLAVYRARLTGTTVPLRLSSELKRN